ncbi:MAG: hypothetical protein Kow0089_22480 [Desulfobulbaceae bacterium]
MMTEKCGCAGLTAAASEGAGRTGDNDENRKIMVLVTADHLGYGDRDLGGKLLLNFLKTLPEMGPSLWRLVLVNAGVRLAVDGHACLPPLRKLAASGVSVLACSTCLAHFNLQDKQAVGEPTTMVDIVTSMQVADKVLTI